MKTLVTGGAGYIGSVCVERLLEQGHEVVVIDNLQEGHRQAVLPEAVFHEADFSDRAVLKEIFGRHAIDAVIHFAAEAKVGVSMTDPGIYFDTNLARSIVLLEAMRKAQCRKMIFSSTAATYGEPEYVPIDERHPQRPVNAYGESKLMFERVLGWYHRAYGLQYNVFRYFNAAGASERLGEAHRTESHLIPITISVAMGRRRRLQIFGSDYPTDDGTCVRDYVHVSDIADAHILAMDNLDRRPTAAYNLGCSRGYSNLAVLRAVEKMAGRSVPHELAPRRAGDPARLVAARELAIKELGWRPRYESIEEIIESAWKWHSSHPNGYDDA